MRTMCPGLCILSFKYLAAPTRRMIVTAVGTRLPNHYLHQATGSISSTLSFPHSCIGEIDRYCLKTLTEDFLNLLNPISSVILSSAYLSCLHATCALCTFHFHDDNAIVLLCMHLSTYSAACSISLSKFLK